MNIFIIGTPGSGKGTQAKMIADKFNLYHLSTGDLFRAMKDDSELKRIMEKGDLVPDKKVLRIAEGFLEQNKLYDNLVLDGSPRSLYQYEKFKDFFHKHGKKIDYVICLNISDDEAIKRLTARRKDKVTGKIYNLLTNPPGAEVDQKNLIQRKDDKEKAIRERLKVQKVPDDLLSKAKKDDILMEVDGERPIDAIFEDILARIKKSNE